METRNALPKYFATSRTPSTFDGHDITVLEDNVHEPSGSSRMNDFGCGINEGGNLTALKQIVKKNDKNIFNKNFFFNFVLLAFKN